MSRKPAKARAALPARRLPVLLSFAREEEDGRVEEVVERKGRREAERRIELRVVK
jgi:hypothetical protein